MPNVVNKEPRVCLAMQAKDRPEIVRRALASAKPLIHAAIVSVEPDDPLGRFVSDLFAEWKIPCEVVEYSRVDPAVGYIRGSYARTLLFQNAERFAKEHDCGWLVNLDADDELEYGGSFRWPENIGEPDPGPGGLPNHSYILIERSERPDKDGAPDGAPTMYPFLRVFRVGLGWYWEYPFHELPRCSLEPHTANHNALSGLTYKRHEDGDRGTIEEQRARYALHARAFRDWLADPANDPNDSRVWFYYARSLLSSGDTDEAVAAFLKRREMETGWDDERWYAAFELARVCGLANDPWEEVRDHYLRAIELGPFHAESMVALARHYEKRGSELIEAAAKLRESGETKPADLHVADSQRAFATAILYARRAMDLPPMVGGIFCHVADYTWNAADVCAGLCARVGEVRLGERMARAALEMKPPPDVRDRIEANLKRLGEIQTPDAKTFREARST